MKTVIKLLIGLIICLSNTSCLDNPEKEETINLLSYVKRDTISVELSLYTESFYGKYYLKGPGDYIVEGEIIGEVKGDTLVGTIYYAPYKWKEKKRRPFALIQRDGKYIQGKGLELYYMGIPYFSMNSITFAADNITYSVIN